MNQALIPLLILGGGTILALVHDREQEAPAGPYPEAYAEAIEGGRRYQTYAGWRNAVQRQAKNMGGFVRYEGDKDIAQAWVVLPGGQPQSLGEWLGDYGDVFSLALATVRDAIQETRQ